MTTKGPHLRPTDLATEFPGGWWLIREYNNVWIWHPQGRYEFVHAVDAWVNFVPKEMRKPLRRLCAEAKHDHRIALRDAR